MMNYLRTNMSLVIKTIEMHAGGGGVRIVQSGYPKIIGDTLHDKLQYAQKNLDHLRKMLTHEPRGSNRLHGIVQVEHDNPEADMAILFLYTEGYSNFCGHATIGLGRYAVDHGIVKRVSPETAIKIQCPTGLVTAHVEYENGRAGAVRFECVPAFVYATDLMINMVDYGDIKYDISVGGSFYIYTNIKQFGLDLVTSSAADIKATAHKMMKAVGDTITMTHPVDDQPAVIGGVYFFSGPLAILPDTINEICIFFETVCRSPCGSGSCGLLALLHHKGLIKEGDVRRFVNSKTQSVFSGRVVKQVKVKDTPAVIPEISGKAYYTGECTFFCEQDDPQPSFLIK